MTDLVMEKADFVIATGGAAMVKAAYSSGTPAFGVGAGNSCSFVDDTAALAKTAEGIRMAEMNDWGSGCSTENSVMIHEAVYDQMIECLKKEGGYLCNAEEKEKLINTIWKNGKLNVEAIIHTPQQIAKLAGFPVPDDCTFLMAEESVCDHEHMMVEEKLSPVIAVWKVKDVDDAIDLVNRIHAISGAGHSCSIHSTNFALMILLVMVQVILRFLFENGFSWGEEVARILFVWMAFSSFGYLTRKGRHVRVGFFTGKLPESAQKVVLVLCDVLFLVFSVVGLRSSWSLCMDAIRFGDELTAIPWNYSVLYFAGVLGFLMMAIRNVQVLVWRLRNRKESMARFENYDGVYYRNAKICFAPKELDTLEQLERVAEEKLEMGD